MKTYVDRLTRLRGENVQVYNESLENCTVCGYNADNNSGLNPFCPTCLGKGKVAREIVTEMVCRVFWQPLKVSVMNVGTSFVGEMYFYVEDEDFIKGATRIVVKERDVVPIRYDYVDSYLADRVRVTCNVRSA